jgi:hypothetical protein
MFAVSAVLVALLVPCAVLLAIDIYLHGRFAKTGGFNIWGYRGPTVPSKKAGEYRVVFLGGSTAYGYGVNWDEAIPAVLERGLAAQSGASGQTFRVVNLGYNNEGAYAFKYTLDDYLWLNYDLACLYEGMNDLMGDPNGPNLSLFRHDSPIFRLTGYVPIFPVIFREKSAAMLHGGDVGAAYPISYRGDKTVFRPSLAARTGAGLLEAAATVGQSLEHQVGRIATEPRRQIVGAGSTGCRYPWQEYCRSMQEAVEFALRHDKQVLVITQPYGVGAAYRARHMDQQNEMKGMLQRRFGTEPRVHYVSLGDAVDLFDVSLSFDRMHLTPEGNRRAAARLITPVREMASRAAPARRSQP